MNVNKVVEIVKEQLGEEYDVKVLDVPKNNGIVEKKINISRKGDKISPTIGLNEDITSEEEMAKWLIETYKENAVEGVNIDDVFTKDYILSHVIPALINKERNEELLESAVSRDFLDLAIVYRVHVKNEQMGEGTYLIKKSHLGQRDITEEELFTASMKNIAPNYHIVNLTEMLLGLRPDDEDIRVMLKQSEMQGPRLYVMSNDEGVFGANCMLNDEAMDELHEVLESEDIVILPSSIHEVIALPASSEGDISYPLKEMVNDVNTTQLALKDILSSSVYYHNRESGWRVA